jgi:hypothetical protein
MLANSSFGNQFSAALPLCRHPTLVALCLALTHGEREKNVTGCVHYFIHIMVVFHSLAFIESNLKRREYHFVNN